MLKTMAGYVAYLVAAGMPDMLAWVLVIGAAIFLGYMAIQFLVVVIAVGGFAAFRRRR